MLVAGATAAAALGSGADARRLAREHCNCAEFRNGATGSEDVLCIGPRESYALRGEGCALRVRAALPPCQHLG